MENRSFINALMNDTNVSVTENGAIGYKTTHNYLVDMNFAVASYRSKSDADIITDFEQAYAQNPEYAMKWLFFVRDIRGGLGERRLFRVITRNLAEQGKIIPYLNLFAEYGRYDDIINLYTINAVSDNMKKCNASIINIIRNTLAQDVENSRENKPITLLAKWMPSINTSSKDTVNLAYSIMNDLNWCASRYRKTLSHLRSKLKIVECSASSNNWGDINYNEVPSIANLKYKNAFLKHDTDRRNQYLCDLASGKKNVKINSSVSFPYELVNSYMEEHNCFRCSVFNYDETLEQMWKALPNYTTDSTLVVADGSGSMTVSVGNSKVTALDVANSIAIYCAERCKGEFKNKYITFSMHPTLVNLPGTSLHADLMEALKHDECADTNIEAVFDLVLNTAINHHMSNDDLPKNILIISDMEFNSCACSNETIYGNYGCDASLFNVIRNKFNRAGYSMPKLIFWNVNSRTNTIPVTENDAGVALVSGFSTNVFNMVTSGKLDPWEILKEQLDSDRYSPVGKIYNNTVNS